MDDLKAKIEALPHHITVNNRVGVYLQDVLALIATHAAEPAPVAVEGKSARIADALEACDWSGCSIGNKTLLRAAVAQLRAALTEQANIRSPVQSEMSKMVDPRKDGK